LWARKSLMVIKFLTTIEGVESFAFHHNNLPRKLIVRRQYFLDRTHCTGTDKRKIPVTVHCTAHNTENTMSVLTIKINMTFL
jgi:hypothetical protein